MDYKFFANAVDALTFLRSDGFRRVNNETLFYTESRVANMKRTHGELMDKGEYVVVIMSLRDVEMITNHMKGRGR
jgi:hypothetical protein